MADDALLEDDVLMPEPAPEEEDLAELGLGESDEDAHAEPDAAAEAAADLQDLDAEAEEADAGLQEAVGADEQEELADVAAQEEEEDDDASVQADEAEEELPQKGKRSDAQEQKDMREYVRALVGQMEAAMNADRDDCEHGRPATRKLKMLHKIDDAVAKVKMHHILLGSGFVGILKGFLEPLETNKKAANGHPVLTLPHAKVRACVYRALRKLPIDTLESGSLHMLKESKIGPVLKFYSQVKDETPENRKAVQDLLKAWMQPMVDDGRKAMQSQEHEDLRREEDRVALKRQRMREREAEAADAKRLAAAAEGTHVGDAGYRYHARVPRAARPDYVNAPAVADNVRRLAQEGKNHKDPGYMSRLNKASQALQRAKRTGDARSSKVELSTKRVGNDLV